MIVRRERERGSTGAKFGGLGVGVGGLVLHLAVVFGEGGEGVVGEVGSGDGVSAGVDGVLRIKKRGIRLRVEGCCCFGQKRKFGVFRWWEDD